MDSRIAISSASSSVNDPLVDDHKISCRGPTTAFVGEMGVPISVPGGNWEIGTPTDVPGGKRESGIPTAAAPAPPGGRFERGIPMDAPEDGVFVVLPPLLLVVVATPGSSPIPNKSPVVAGLGFSPMAAAATPVSVMPMDLLVSDGVDFKGIGALKKS